MSRKHHSVRVIFMGILFFSACLWTPVQSMAADFPTKPLQLIAPFGPGGIADISCRLFSAKSEEILGQPMVVLNKPGAGGSLGADFVAKSKPDGYTLGLGGTSNLIINKVMNPNLSYDPRKDLSLISLVMTFPLVILVKEDSPLNTFEKLMDFAKKSPGKLTYAGAGVASPSHFFFELFQQASGIQVVHVPPKGEGPALMALLGGHIDVGIITPAASGEQIAAKKVIPLAVTSSKRFRDLPQVPSISEKGYPSAVLTSWIGYFGPAGLPKPIADKLAAFFKKAMDFPDMQEKMRKLGMDQTYLGPSEFARFIREQIDQFQDVAKKANIKVE